MDQPKSLHGLMTERPLWLVVAFVVGLVLAVQAVAAKECHQETPLPADVRRIAPGPEVPEAVARFAGAWTGAWERTDGFCHTLVVEEVLVNGYARVIYSHGTSMDLNVPLPGFWRVTGRIVDGVLRFHLPEPERPELASQVAGETLSGTFQGKCCASLTRVVDVRQISCVPQAGGLPPAPPTTGPRDRLTAAELLASADSGQGPVHNAYFMPVGQAAPALHAFKGTMTVQAPTMFRGHHGYPGLAEILSGFSVALFTHGEHLVPVLRNIGYPPGFILSPGQVWSEPGDGGLSRASFPFVLTSDGVSRNGLAIFLYDDTHVSGLRFQVIQENCPNRNKYDGWGQSPLTYTPGTLIDEQGVRAQFTEELRHHVFCWPVPVGAQGSPAL